MNCSGVLVFTVCPVDSSLSRTSGSATMRAVSRDTACTTLAGVLAGFEQGIQKHGLLTLNAFNLGAEAGALHEFFDDLVMSSHA